MDTVKHLINKNATSADYGFKYFCLAVDKYIKEERYKTIFKWRSFYNEIATELGLTSDLSVSQSAWFFVQDMLQSSNMYFKSLERSDLILKDYIHYVAMDIMKQNAEVKNDF